MTRLLTTLLLSLFAALSLSAQSYEQGMGKAFGLMQEGKIKEASAIFEMISNKERNNWIPTYHAANTLIIAAFNDQNTETRMMTLNKAKELIAKAHQRSENNSEIYTLEGLLYTSYVTIDPQTYGMQYSGKIMGLHSKAIDLDPENPRALANKIEWEMGAARFMGGDVQAICEKMQDVIPKFENQKSEEPFTPQFGIERAKQVAANCNG